MTRADWLPYALPLGAPWRTSRGSAAVRHGRLLRLTAEDGLKGWGDCAPLPEFGVGEAAAAAFAEECAQLDLAAQRAHLPLAEWLGGRPAARALAVNASLGSLLAVSREDVAAACAAGFRVLKLKVGVAPVAEEIRRLRHLAETLPADCRLRLDANGAWRLAEARQFLTACRDLPVEACEDPLDAADFGALAGLQAGLPFALAIDEMPRPADDEFFARPPVRRMVIKPARHGGLRESMALARRARAAGIETIISSALESSCGLLACAHLAAAVAPEAVHGLATASWFVHDTGTPAVIENGRLLLPERPGCGFIWAGDAAPAFAYSSASALPA